MQMVIVMAPSTPLLWVQRVEGHVLPKLLVLRDERRVMVARSSISLCGMLESINYGFL